MMKHVLILSVIVLSGACSKTAVKSGKEVTEEKTVVITNPAGKGEKILVELTRGKSFYYPLFAIWVEDSSGRYIQTLYVAKSVATGVFRMGKEGKNWWVEAPKRAPQTLPFWAHKRGIQASDGLFVPDSTTSVPDAYSGATPVRGFILESHADNHLPLRFKVMLEINQNWDWNEYWTNDRYPDDENYKMSCQPSLVFEADINLKSPKETYPMNPVGHGHYSGKTGELFPDLSSLTTALHIADSIIVSVK